MDETVPFNILKLNHETIIVLVNLYIGVTFRDRLRNDDKYGCPRKNKRTERKLSRPRSPIHRRQMDKKIIEWCPRADKYI